MAIAFLLATALIPPSRADVVDAAADFVPAAARDMRIEPLTGSPIILGHDFYVVVDMGSAAAGSLGLAQSLLDEGDWQRLEGRDHRTPGSHAHLRVRAVADDR